MINTFPIKPGVGDVDDLYVKLHENTGNRWYPQLQSGTFYLGGRENYLYASEGWEDVTIPHGINTLSLTSQADLLTAARHGPILLDGEWYQYIRSTNCLNVFISTTFTNVPSGGQLMSSTIPGRLVMLTDTAGLEMHSVPSTGYLVDRRYYYWDEDTRIAYINRDLTDPLRSEALYATYLQDTPKLLQEEILCVGSDNLIRSAFGRVIFGASGTVLNPSITVIGTGTMAASAVVDNVIHPASGLVEGTRVGVRYYIDKSYMASLVGANLSITVCSSGTDHATLRWEDAFIYSYFDTGTFPSSGLNYVQLNPTLTGTRSGFIYLDQYKHPALNLATLNLSISPIRVSNKFRQSTRFTVEALDRDNNKVSNIPIQCWVMGDGVNYTTTNLRDEHSLLGTDYNGECHFSFSPAPEMFGTYTVMASGLNANNQTLTASGYLEILEPLMLSDAIDSAKVFLYLSPNKDASGFRDLFVYLSNQSGIPYPGDLDVAVRCESGRLYNTSTFASTGTVTGSREVVIDFAEADNLSGLRVATCKYVGEVGDMITARPASTSSVSTLYSFQSVPIEVL